VNDGAQRTIASDLRHRRRSEGCHGEAKIWATASPAPCGVASTPCASKPSSRRQR
jgi:hypothetical protein